MQSVYRLLEYMQQLVAWKCKILNVQHFVAWKKIPCFKKFVYTYKYETFLNFLEVGI